MTKRGYILFVIGLLNSMVFYVCSGQTISEAIVTGDTSDHRQSDVEFLIGVSQIIEKDKDRLRNLHEDSITLEPLFQRLTARFYEVDAVRDSLREQSTPQNQTTIIDYQWQRLRDILDFLLDRKRTMALQRKILEHKITKEQEVFDFFMKGEVFAILEATLRKGWQESVEEENSAQSDSSGVTNPKQNEADEFNWSIVEMEREVQVLEARFEVSKKTWMFLEQLLALNQDDLFLAKSLAKKSSELLVKWRSHMTSMQNELDSLSATDSATAVRDEIRKSLNQMALMAARMKNRGIKDSLLVSDIDVRMTRLKGIQSPLTKKVRDAGENIEKKKRRLKFMKSPLAPHRILFFVVNNGPRIGFLILMFLAIYLGLRWLIKAALPKFRFKRYKTIEEQQERIETLSRAFRSGLTIVILVVAVLTLLSEFGINVSVLLGGAAVFSLAIAFGAQSLIKDYFSGLMIISENQYRVGNVVNINNVSGVVEDITLRMTILRDIEGTAHFIPHGEIKIVSNLGYMWSQVALEVKIGYTENVDKAMAVVMDVAKGLQADTVFGRYIISAPELLGVDSFADSCLIVKILVKTHPLKQWLIKRELLRRIKNRFDEEGIEIPLPYQRIYYTPDATDNFNEKINDEPPLKENKPGT